MAFSKFEPKDAKLCVEGGKERSKQCSNLEIRSYLSPPVRLEGVKLADRIQNIVVKSSSSDSTVGYTLHRCLRSSGKVMISIINLGILLRGTLHDGKIVRTHPSSGQKVPRLAGCTGTPACRLSLARRSEYCYPSQSTSLCGRQRCQP
jgi:hypothetical protein